MPLHFNTGIGLTSAWKFSDEDYWMNHRPARPGDDDESTGAPFHAVDRVMPDYYERPDLYRNGFDPDSRKYDAESTAAIMKARGNPDAPVTIYRASPNNVINNGDWVTPSPSYAQFSGMHPTDPSQDLPVTQATVPASSLWTAGDSHNEFGYWGDPRQHEGSWKFASGIPSQWNMGVVYPTQFDHPYKGLIDAPFDRSKMPDNRTPFWVAQHNQDANDHKIFLGHPGGFHDTTLVPDEYIPRASGSVKNPGFWGGDPQTESSRVEFYNTSSPMEKHLPDPEDYDELDPTQEAALDVHNEYVKRLQQNATRALYNEFPDVLGSPTPRESSWKFADYYHLAPTQERDRIKQHGLQAANPYYKEDRWQPTWDRPAGPPRHLEGQPTGVYVGDEDQARKMREGDPRALDMWRIPGDVQALENPNPGDDSYNTRYIPHNVDAELHSPYESTLGEDQAFNQEPVNPWQLQQDMRPYRSIQELSQDPEFKRFNPWGIGRPNQVWGSIREAESAYYHGAPTIERSRIMQHGLQPSNPQLNGIWQLTDAGIEPEYAEMMNSHRSTEPGVYMTTNPENVSKGKGGENDIWRIDPSYVTNTKNDPAWENAAIATHPIPPEALTLHQPVEDRMWNDFRSTTSRTTLLPTHINRWTGLPCSCGWGDIHKRPHGLMRVAGQEMNRLRKDQSKALRTPEGEAFRQHLLSLPEHYDPLVPYLANRFRKGDLRRNPELGPEWTPELALQDLTNPMQVNPEWSPEFADSMRSQYEPQWQGISQLHQWLQWYNARQHPTRKGINAMDPDFTPQKMRNAVQNHQRALEESQRKQKWIEKYNNPNLPTEDPYPGGYNNEDPEPQAPNVVHRFGPEAGKYKGWNVTKLNPYQAMGDSDANGYCIGWEDQPYRYNIGIGNIDAYSLRDPEGYPHVSWHFNPGGMDIGHMQGKSGDPPEHYRNLMTQFHNAHGLSDEEGYEEQLEEPDRGDEEIELPPARDVDEYNGYYDEPYSYAEEHGNVGEDTNVIPNYDYNSIARDYLSGTNGHDPISRFHSAVRYQNDHSDVANALKEEFDPTDIDHRNMASEWNNHVALYGHHTHMIDIPQPVANEVDQYNNVVDEGYEPNVQNWDDLANDYIKYHETYAPKGYGQTYQPGEYDRFHNNLQNYSDDYGTSHLPLMQNALEGNMDWEDPDHQMAARYWNDQNPRNQIHPPQQPQAGPYDGQYDTSQGYPQQLFSKRQSVWKFADATDEPPDSLAPIDELTRFLNRGTAAPAGSISPNNPLSPDAHPEATLSNPATNPNIPGSYANPSNPNLNPSAPGATNNPANPAFNPSIPGAKNNPGNPQFNPALPSAVNNAANPELNPAYPGSWANPSSPMHNPDIPNPMQAFERPQSLGPDASFPTPPSFGMQASARKWAPVRSWTPWVSMPRLAEYNDEDVMGTMPCPACSGTGDTPDENGCDECRGFGYVEGNGLYHAAPTTERNRIMQHGLQVSSPALSEQWGGVNNAPGVYVADDPSNTARGMNDVWKVDPAYVRNAERDHVWGDGNSWRIPHNVPAEALSMHRPYEVWPRPKEDSGEVWPAVAEIKNHPEWGIGKPNHVWGAWHFGADIPGAEMGDSRDWPDPTQPRSSEPPTPRGCTCDQGLKLECPVHGMHPTEADFDHSWSIPQGNPVGYPQGTGAPRGWSAPYTS